MVPPISLISLICNPSRYDDQVVAFIGYVMIGSPVSAAFLSEADFRNGITKNAVALDVNPDEYLAANQRYAILQGVFASPTSSWDWSGTLHTVTRVQSKQNPQ